MKLSVNKLHNAVLSALIHVYVKRQSERWIFQVFFGTNNISLPLSVRGFLSSLQEAKI